MFDWDHIISNEVPFHLGNFQKTRKFHMTSYLVYTIGVGDNQNPQEGSPEKHQDDIDTLVSTIDQYIQKG
jgi:hypothetical protein